MSQFMNVHRIASALIVSAPLFGHAASTLAQAPAARASVIEKQWVARNKADVQRSIVDRCEREVEIKVQAAESTIAACPCSASDKQRKVLALQESKIRAFARCRKTGVDAQIAYIINEENARLAALEHLTAQFSAQARSYNEWAADSLAAYDKSIDKLGELTLTTIATALLDLTAEAFTHRIDAMLGRITNLREPRRVRTTELKEFVLSLHDELKGKSKVEAKATILERLKTGRKSISDLAALGGRLSTDAARIAGSHPTGPASAESESELKTVLDESYETILTAVRLAQTHGALAVTTLSKTASILALVPDMIDTAALLYRVGVSQNNIEGLDSLATATELQRQTKTTSLTVLVQERRMLEMQRHQLERETVQ
jgi:hypothetical protein